MNLFETDFLKKTKALLAEAFKMKKYNAMHLALSVCTFILMLPILLFSLIVAAILAVLCFTFTVLSSPVKYLHDLVHTEGQSVKHATQVVIYLISWPLVFFLYVLMSITLLLIIPTYALLSILLYAWSLGGFKFHLFANTHEDISVEVNGRYLVLPIVFIVIGALLLLLMPLFHGIFLYADLYKNYMEAQFLDNFTSIYLGYFYLHCIFAFLYSIIGFAAHAPKNIPDNSVNEYNE